MSRRYTVSFLFALTLFAAFEPDMARAQVLVGNPFISPTSNWVDAFPPPTAPATGGSVCITPLSLTRIMPIRPRQVR